MIFPFFTENHTQWKKKHIKKMFFEAMWKTFPLFAHTFSPSFSITFCIRPIGKIP